MRKSRDYVEGIADAVFTMFFVIASLTVFAFLR